MERYDIFTPITNATSSSTYESEVYNATDSGVLHVYANSNTKNYSFFYKIDDGSYTSITYNSETEIPVTKDSKIQFRITTPASNQSPLNSNGILSLWFAYDSQDSLYTAFIVTIPYTYEPSIGFQNVKYWEPEASNPVLVVKEADNWVTKTFGNKDSLTTNTAIVICDYHNSSIKVVDTDYNVVQSITLEEKPFCMVDFVDNYNGYTYLLVATNSKIYQYYLNENNLLVLKASKSFDNIQNLANTGDLYTVITKESLITIDPISLISLNTTANSSNFDTIDYDEINGNSSGYQSISGYCRQIATPGTFLNTVPAYNIFSNTLISKTWNDIPTCIDTRFKDSASIVGHYTGQIIESAVLNSKTYSVDCAIYDMTVGQGSTIGFGYTQRQNVEGGWYYLNYPEYKTDVALSNGTEIFNNIIFVAGSPLLNNLKPININYFGFLNSNLINQSVNDVITSISVQHDIPEMNQITAPIVVGGYILYFNLSTGEIILKLYFDPVDNAKVGTIYQSNTIAVPTIGNPVSVSSSRLTFYINGIKQDQPVLVSSLDNVYVEFKPNVYGATVINNIYSVTDTGATIEKVGEFQVTAEPIGGDPLPPSSNVSGPILIDNTFNRDVFWHSNFTIDSDFYDFLKSTLYAIDITGFNVSYDDWIKGIIASHFTHLSFNSITSKAGTYILESLTRAFFEDTYVIYKNFLATYHFASFSQFLQLLNQYKIDTNVILEENNHVYGILTSYQQDINSTVYKITTSFIQVIDSVYSYFMKYELDKNSETYTFKNNAIYATLQHNYVDTRTNILTYFEQFFIDPKYSKENTTRQFFIDSIINVFDQAFYFYESVYVFGKKPNNFLIDISHNKYTTTLNLSEYVDYIRQQSNTYLNDLNYEFFYPVVHEYGCNTSCQLKGMFDNEEDALEYARKHYPEEKILRAIEIDGCWTYLIKTEEGSGCPLPDVQFPYKGYIRGG